MFTGAVFFFIIYLLMRATEKLHPTVKMAVVDALPVLFFAVSMSILAVMLKSPLFGLGAFLSFLAGTGKVLWKLFLAVKKTAYDFLKKPFPILMSLGFILMIVAVVLSGRRINWNAVHLHLFSLPGFIHYGFGLCFFIVMIVLGFTLDMDMEKSNWIEQIVNCLAQGFILLGIVYSFIGTFYYHPDETALVNTHGITISETPTYYYFQTEEVDTLLIFYPGAKVDEKAYFPLMKQFADSKVDCILIKEPYKLAFHARFTPNKPLKLYGEKYQHIFTGGHSLGGVVAGTYGKHHSDKIEGTLFLASYPTKEYTSSHYKCIFVNGTKDLVLNRKMWEKNKTPGLATCTYLEIEGGNHGGFGNYGQQKGDGTATISNESQQAAAVKFFLENR